MNFEEWADKNTVFDLQPHTTRDWLRMVWEASKAEERERCLQITKQYTGAVVSLIAEQIRKGE